MNELASGTCPAYSFHASAKSVVSGFSSPSSNRRVAPDKAFFYTLSHHLNGGLRGETSRSAGFLFDRSANPALVRRPSFSSERGGLQVQIGVPL